MLIRRAAEKTLDIGEKRRFLRLDTEQIIKGDIVAQGDRYNMRLALIAHTDKHIASGKNIEQTGGDGMGNGHNRRGVKRKARMILQAVEKPAVPRTPQRSGGAQRRTG